jgi:hypothetical protein
MVIGRQRSCSRAAAAAAIGTPPVIIIQPVKDSVGIGSSKRLSSTVPSAHEIAAASMSTTPVAALAIPARSPPRRIATPLIPSSSARPRCAVSRSSSSQIDKIMLHSGME